MGGDTIKYEHSNIVLRVQSVLYRVLEGTAILMVMTTIRRSANVDLFLIVNRDIDH